MLFNPLVMKFSIYIIIFLLIFKPALPVLNYMLNREAIVKEYCQNIQKPELNCNGKCHLKAELAKASADNTPYSAEKKIHTEETVLFITDIPLFTPAKQFWYVLRNKVMYYSNLYALLNTTAVFHPPVF